MWSVRNKKFHAKCALQGEKCTGVLPMYWCVAVPLHFAYGDMLYSFIKTSLVFTGVWLWRTCVEVQISFPLTDTDIVPLWLWLVTNKKLQCVCSICVCKLSWWCMSTRHGQCVNQVLSQVLFSCRNGVFFKSHVCTVLYRFTLPVIIEGRLAQGKAR